MRDSDANALWSAAGAAALAGSRQAAATAAIVALGAVVMLALSIHPGATAADMLDARIRAASAWLDPVAAALNVLGQLPFWAALVAIQGVLARRRPWLAVELLAVSAAAEGLSAVVRLVVDRPRPELAHATDLVIAAGFPSGHVARAVVFAATTLVVVPWLQRHRGAWLVFGIALVALMADARLLASAHYASDTLGGALLGAAVVGVWSLVTRLRRLGAGAAPSSPGAPGGSSRGRPSR
jgi:membrane-associated phospholipid phosphatase